MTFKEIYNATAAQIEARMTELSNDQTIPEDFDGEWESLVTSLILLDKPTDRLSDGDK